MRNHGRMIFLWLIFCCLSCPVAGVMITEFCPDGYAKGDGDEYFILSGTGDLSEWSVTDGEGSITFPKGTISSGKIIVAREGAAYHSIHGTFPDYEIYDTLPEVSNLIRSGRFQMANAKDELMLFHNSVEKQKISWPDDVAAGNGRIHVFTEVWDERIFKIGQSRFSPETFVADKVTLFVSPDCSYEVVRLAILSAKESLKISMYEFTHPELAVLVGDAAKRGVNVTLLIEGGPVGGVSDEEKGVLDYLSDKGVFVYTMKSTDSLPARYRYLHAKYLISDDDSVLILSENFKPSGVPVSGTKGNRGWGVFVEDSDVANYFAKVFSHDLSGYDVYLRRSSEETFPKSFADQRITLKFQPLTLYNVEVVPVISPDTSHLVLDMIDAAETSMDIQQAYISPYPNGAHNLWMKNATFRGGCGIVARVLLDGMYYNLDGEYDNDEMAANLNREANLRNISLEARIMHETDEITKLHNKGMIIDGNLVLISSINWNYNSPNNNREAGIILKSSEGAWYFTRVFNYDWEGGSSNKKSFISTTFITDQNLRLGACLVILILLLAIWAVKRRR